MTARWKEIDDMIPPTEPPGLMDEPVRMARPSAVGRSPRPSGLAVLTWADLLDEPDEPPPTLARGIPKVGLTVLAGPPKVGKTLYASQTALTAASRVLMILEEGSRAGIAYRLRKQVHSLGIPAPDIAVLLRQHVRLDDRGSVSRIRDLVAERRPDLVLCDPLNRLHNGDENRPSQMTPVMDALAGIAYDFETAVLANHHLAKPSAERRGDIWDRFRGATSIRSGTDSNLIMDGTGATVRLYGEFRDAEPMNVYIALDRETLLFHDADAPEAATKVDAIALRLFVEERRQVTARQVMDEFGVAKHTALRAVRALGCDEFEGPRRVLTFSLGTVQ